MKLLLKKVIKLKKYYSLKWKKKMKKREFFKQIYGKITQENEKSSFKATKYWKNGKALH